MLTLLPVLAPTPAAAVTGWTGWVSSPTDAGRRLKAIPSVASPGSRAITIDPAQKLGQTWLGVGASLTDASVTHLAGRTDLQNRLFNPTQANGARLNLLRLPLSATDFSPRHWAWGWNGSTATPPADAVRAADLARTLKGIRPSLQVVGVPWSAPAAMKENRSLYNGYLTNTSSNNTQFGNMLASQVAWLQNRGVPLRYLSLGNEPALCVDRLYPTMCMRNGQMASIASAIYDRLKQRNVTLWAYDHNWEHRGEVDSVLALAPTKFSASAFHCYGGTPAQMSGVKAPPIISECTGENKNDEAHGWAGTFRWDSQNLVVDSIKAGSTGLMMWNLALVNSGPQLGSQCPVCRGVLDGTTSTNLAPGPEFYVLAHLSRAANPGDRPIRVTDEGGLPVVAFVRPDGSSVGVYGHNNTGSAQNISVRVAGRQPVSFTVPAGELFTFRGPASGSTETVKSILRSTTTGARFYVDPSGWRHRIDSDAVYGCLGGDANVRSALDEEINAYREGEAAACLSAQPGDIIRHPDGDSYVVSGTASALVRHWIPTAADFVCARAEANRRVVEVTRYQVDQITRGANRPGGNCLIRGPGGDSHFVNNEGRREWVPDSPTWDCEIGRGVRVLEVAAEFIGTVDEVGWHYCLNQANLQNKILRHSDGDSSYIHPDNTRTWIPDTPTWQCRLNRGTPVVDTRWREYVTSFVDTGWDYCFDPAVFRGRIIRHADGDSSYVHPDDSRTWIPDGATWQCRMNRGTAVVDTRWRQYVNNFRDTGWDYCYDVNALKGRIISHPDGDSHFVDSRGVRHWIPSPQIYNCLRARGIPADTVRWRDYITRTPEGEWAVCGDTITTNQKLDRGQWLVSSDGRYRLHMQDDGNLVAYNAAGRAIWATNRGGTFAVVQADGNFVEYGGAGAVWATNTAGTGGNRLVMQSDGNIVLYSATRAVWASNTVGR